MKKIASIATIAVMSFAGSLKGVDPIEFLPNFQAKGCGKSQTRCKIPSGSYYADSTSQALLQNIPDTPIPSTTPIHFSGTNVNGGVLLSPDGNSIVVPKRGYYKIEWNVSLFPSNAVSLRGFFNLQKNGTTLLHPIPQVADVDVDVGGSYTGESCAASVIVPLCALDEISLLFTMDGTEGGGSLNISSAQISAHFISEFCH